MYNTLFTIVISALSTVAIISLVIMIFSLGGKSQCEDINKTECELVTFWQPFDL